MRKLIMISILTIMMWNVFSQKTKTFQIWEKTFVSTEILPGFVDNEFLQAYYNYDSNNEVESVYIHFEAQDSRYFYIIESITIYYGTPKEFYSFLNEVEAFCNKEKESLLDMTIRIHGQIVTSSELMDIKKICISEKDKDGDGFHIFYLDEIVQFKEKFVQWANENNISYN